MNCLIRVPSTRSGLGVQSGSTARTLDRAGGPVHVARQQPGVDSLERGGASAHTIVVDVVALDCPGRLLSLVQRIARELGVCSTSQVSVDDGIERLGPERERLAMGADRRVGHLVCASLGGVTVGAVVAAEHFGLGLNKGVCTRCPVAIPEPLLFLCGHRSHRASIAAPTPGITQLSATAGTGLSWDCGDWCRR